MDKDRFKVNYLKIGTFLGCVVISANIPFFVREILKRYYIQVPYLGFALLGLSIFLFIILFGIMKETFDEFSLENQDKHLRLMVIFYFIGLIFDFLPKLYTTSYVLHLSAVAIGYIYFEKHGSLQGKSIFYITFVTIIIETLCLLVAL